MQDCPQPRNPAYLHPLGSQQPPQPQLPGYIQQFKIGIRIRMGL